MKAEPVLVRVSTAVIKQHDLKATWGRKIYFLLQLIVHYPGKSGQEVKAGTEADAVEECCLVA